MELDLKMDKQTLAEILHALVATGIGAAAIFVKNPESQQHAGQIINLVQTTVLPIADAMLNGPTSTTLPVQTPQVGSVAGNLNKAA